MKSKFFTAFTAALVLATFTSACFADKKQQASIGGSGVVKRNSLPFDQAQKICAGRGLAGAQLAACTTKLAK